MLKILVVNTLDNSLRNLVAPFRKSADIGVSVVETGNQALINLSSETFNLVVAAQELHDMSGLDLIKKIVAANPMVNCAVASDLAPKEFHEASEGLGILMQLPAFPKTEHAEALLNQVQDIFNLLAQD